MTPLRISLLQTDIAWEEKPKNLCRLREMLETLRGKTELAILPETFTTGFSMNPASVAEPIDGETISTLKQWASTYGIALAGSYIACTPSSEHCNRAFFLTPEGDIWLSHLYNGKYQGAKGAIPSRINQDF